MVVQPFPLELKHLYTSAELIGSGGFARVFRARRKDGRVVAVKIPLNLDEATGRSFLREITSWQRLAHRNIVSLFDANILPIPYLELEYVEGGNLEDMEKPLEVANACEIVFDIAEGLKYAHKQGIVHRDLKPHNVLLTKEQFPKITDWGLSRVIAESKSSSQYSFSPVYAAPEQVSPKKFGKPDERTDIYQLGVIFYNLLTDELPFKGEDLTEIATAIALEEPVPPSELNPDAREVENIVLRCIAKKKEDRYQSVGELQKELAEFIKRDYKESLKLSLGAGDMRRSAFYCAELCLVHARLGDVKEALKFALDLKNYAGGEAKKDVDALVEGLKFRMEKGLRIDEELFNKMEVVLHQVKMGWGKSREKPERDELEKLRREEEEHRKREGEKLRKEKEEQERLRRQTENEERARREKEERERLRREEEQKQEKEKQDRLRRLKEQEEKAQRERKEREESERREKERQARQEEERQRRQLGEGEKQRILDKIEEVIQDEPKEERTSFKKFFAVALVLGVLVLGYWALASGPINSPHVSIKVSSIAPPTNVVELQHRGGDAITLSDVKIIVEQENSKVTITTTNRSEFQVGDTLGIYTIRNSTTNDWSNNLVLNNNFVDSTKSVGAFYMKSGSELTVKMIYAPNNELISVNNITPIATISPTSTPILSTTTLITPPASPTPLLTQAADLKTFTNSIGMEFVLIPAGEYDMGSPSNEAGRFDDEGPVHRVKIAKTFYMGKYEVMQKQWREVMGSNPSYFKGDNLPVESVSWSDVQQFIKKLNEREGTNKYRLPSEAEWEYVARAGTITRYSFGDDESKLDDYAWNAGNSGSKTHEVGQKKPNPWGLYDVHGNVWEWVQDIYHSSYNGAPTDGSAWEEGDTAYHVNRGGSWGYGYDRYFRSANRDHNDASERYYDDPGVRVSNLGFRLVRDV